MSKTRNGPGVTQRIEMRQGDKVQLFSAAGLFVLLSLFGAHVCYSSVKDFSSARASGKWAQTSAVILSSNEGELRYAYFHDGRRLEGNRLSFSTRGLIGNMPSTIPGDTVTAYVSPEDPGMSVLVPGGSGRRFAVWFAFGGLVLFVGFAGLIRTMMAVDFPELDVRVPKDAMQPQALDADGDVGNGAYSPAE